ncbi:MAG: hypothetical protein NVS3B20_07570 [Polyangiales bacterium]
MACTGTTRAEIGSDVCKETSDCEAPFPPPGAVVVHDAAGLSAALLRSDSVIAVNDGNYDALEITRDVRIVGRCASKVSIKGTTLRGVLVQGPIRVAVEGVTITGQKSSVVASDGAVLDLSHVVLSDNLYGIVASGAKVHVDGAVFEGRLAPVGLLAVLSEQGGEVIVANAEVRGYLTAIRSIDRGSTTLRRGIVSVEGPLARSHHLVGAFSEGRITVEESGLYVNSPGTSFAVVGRTLAGVTKDMNPRPGQLRFVSSELSKMNLEDTSWLIGIHQGARVEVEGSTIAHRSDTAFDVRDAESTCSIKSSTIVSVSQPSVSHGAIGVFSGAAADFEAVALVSPSYIGAFVGDQGSRLSFTRSIITGMRSGYLSAAISADRASSLVVDRSAFVDNDNFAIFGSGDAKIEIARSFVSGAGLMFTSASTLAMNDSVVRSSTDAAVTFAASQGVIADSSFFDNAFVLHLDGAHLKETRGVLSPPASGEVIFARNTLRNNRDYVSSVPVRVSVPVPSP